MALECAEPRDPASFRSRERLPTTCQNGTIGHQLCFAFIAVVSRLLLQKLLLHLLLQVHLFSLEELLFINFVFIPVVPVGQQSFFEQLLGRNVVRRVILHLNYIKFKF